MKTRNRASEALLLQTPCFFRKLYARILPQQLCQFVEGRGQKVIFVINQFKGPVSFLILRRKNAETLMTDFMVHQTQRHDRQNLVV